MNKKLLLGTVAASIVAFGVISGTVVMTQVVQSGDRAAATTAVTAVRAGRLFDANAGAMLTNQIVLIKGDRVAEMGPNVQIPAGASVIDLRNATVLPGMIDSHVHVMPRGDQSLPYKTLRGMEQARANLLGGFTTVIDMSGRHTWANIDIRNAINRGLHQGPRMQVAGHEITPRDRSMWPAPSTVDGEPIPGEMFIAGPWLARYQVRKIKHYGADWVKVYNTQDFVADEYQHFKPDGSMVNNPSLTLEELTALVDEAHRREMKVACHAFGGVGLADCVTAGVDKIEHGNVMTDEIARMMKDKNISITFTLQNMIDTPEADLPRSGGKVSRLSLTMDTIKKAKAHGLNIAFGSDTNPPKHGTQAWQFKHYAEWGLTPAESLQTAFMGAARTLNFGWADRVGSLEVGKFADVIAVAGNPLQDLTEMERVKFVMKGGVVVKNDLEQGPTPTSSVGRR